MAYYAKSDRVAVSVVIYKKCNVKSGFELH